MGLAVQTRRITAETLIKPGGDGAGKFAAWPRSSQIGAGAEGNINVFEREHWRGQMRCRR